MRVDGSNWVIKYVFSGSGAEEEDIRVGDELRSINGVAVPDTNASESDHATFLAAVAAARSGATDSMAIVRLGVAYTKTVPTGTYNQHFRTAREFQIAAVGIIKEYPLYAGCYKCVAIPPNGDNITGEMCASANSGHHMCVGLLSDGPPPPIGFNNTCDLSIPNCNMNYS